MLSECDAVEAEQAATVYLTRVAALIAGDTQADATAPDVMDAAERAACSLIFRLAYRRGGSRSVRMLQCLVDSPADHPVAARVA